MTDEQRYECLRQSIESHDRQIGELVENMADLTQRTNSLALRVEQTHDIVQQLAQAMLILAQTTTDHENRIDRLEERN